MSLLTSLLILPNPVKGPTYGCKFLRNWKLEFKPRWNSDFQMLIFKASGFPFNSEHWCTLSSFSSFGFAKIKMKDIEYIFVSICFLSKMKSRKRKMYNFFSILFLTPEKRLTIFHVADFGTEFKKGSYIISENITCEQNKFFF